MRVLLATVGRLKKGPEQALVARYHDRLKSTGKSLGISRVETIEIPESRAANPEKRKTEEARILSKRFPEGAELVVFDERGKSISSREFADLVRKTLENGNGDLIFVIGGPDGNSDGLRNQAGHVVSFGRLTLPHQLVRVLAMEQIYRATTILSGHPYHRV